MELGWLFRSALEWVLSKTKGVMLSPTSASTESRSLGCTKCLPQKLSRLRSLCSCSDFNLAVGLDRLLFLKQNEFSLLSEYPFYFHHCNMQSYGDRDIFQREHRLWCWSIWMCKRLPGVCSIQPQTELASRGFCVLFVLFSVWLYWMGWSFK